MNKKTIEMEELLKTLFPNEKLSDALEYMDQLFSKHGMVRLNEK